jgi:hypothetical protein
MSQVGPDRGRKWWVGEVIGLTRFATKHPDKGRSVLCVWGGGGCSDKADVPEHVYRGEWSSEDGKGSRHWAEADESRFVLGRWCSGGNFQQRNDDLVYCHVHLDSRPCARGFKPHFKTLVHVKSSDVELYAIHFKPLKKS